MNITDGINQINQLFDLIDHLKDYLFYAFAILGLPPIQIAEPPILEKKTKKKKKRKHQKKRK